MYPSKESVDEKNLFRRAYEVDKLSRGVLLLIYPKEYLEVQCMKFCSWVYQLEGYIKWFIILINQKNVSDKIYQSDKSFSRVYYSTSVFYECTSC